MYVWHYHRETIAHSNWTTDGEKPISTVQKKATDLNNEISKYNNELIDDGCVHLKQELLSAFESFIDHEDDIQPDRLNLNCLVTL